MAVDSGKAHAHLDMLDKLDGCQDRTNLTFEEWIDLQSSLQRAIGVDPRDLGPTPERADFVRWNVLACIAELVEMLEEMPWKPWATTTQFDRKAVIREAVDAMHFLGNVLRVVDCDGAELSREYLKKNRRNLERQLEGYDGKTGKCGACKRELADIAFPESLKRVSHTYHHLGQPALVGFCNREHLDLYESTLEAP